MPSLVSRTALRSACRFSPTPTWMVRVWLGRGGQEPDAHFSRGGFVEEMRTIRQFPWVTRPGGWRAFSRREILESAYGYSSVSRWRLIAS
jgi:hypothetical protein